MKNIPSSLPHLRALLELGPRPIGSAANQAAADYIRDCFSALNYQVEEQEYSCTAFDHASTNLYVDETAFPVETNAFSLPCDVHGAVQPLGSIAELQAADITGRIVLFYGDLASQPLSPKSWFLKSERDELIIGCLEAGRPAALLAPPAETAEYMQLTMDWELDLPAATIPLDIALTLLRQPGTPIHLTIQGERRPASARNIVARSSNKSGSSRVVLCAHFDTMINTPGASDNAAGVAVMLALAETLRTENLPYDLEFVAFNGEEYLPIGDDEYLRRSGDSLDDILFAVNIDGIGPAYASSTITMMAAGPAFRCQVEQISAAFPGVVWVEPWLESNHSTFAMRGVPALAFSSRGARRLAHTPNDALHMISTAKMEEVHGLTAEIVRSRPAVTRAEER
jgi:aminopeptidase YwaD